ncbi:WD40-repeat-containing domain protein [Kockovaella imperatae]|uniref:WD40-repeat-containing domain protein n=1 Tax=Kockovaella imperatae TaxID=4999 RepID=A0A1Y1UPR9_9TREE|nr:WD40-repeat-containing domain protein [Kockovaella imperatae]ORX39456.1 WD40-repeat-containing domain protein [Kockovaella imperatae]
MSMYESEFSRRLLASIPPSPKSSSSSHYSPMKPGPDVFGDITLPLGNASPRGASPLGKMKGKAAVRDYGDRFIPTRDGSNLHASFQLMPEIDIITGKEIVSRSKTRRKSLYGQGTDQDVRREEVNATFTQILKTELFPPSSPASGSRSPRNAPSPISNARHRRPMAFHHSGNINLPDSSHTVSSAGTTPMHHHPPPAMAGGERAGERELSPASTLPPLPMHAPSTPTSGHGRAPGAGPSSSHHRAHQSQVALTSTSRTGTTPPNSRKAAFSPPPSTGPGSPSTPTRKRILTFNSPSAARMAALTGGSKGGGLDDMNHERYSLSPVGKDSQRVLLSPRKGVRRILRTPFKVLDAPELADDFYLNLVSWSASNVLGVGLNSCVYLWSAQTSKVTKLCDMANSAGEVNDVITGIEWTNRGSTLAIGTNRGSVEIWDAEYCKKIRVMSGHSGRVGCLAWNSHILSSGSRDRTILHRDTRIPDQYIRRLAGHHKQEVCGLRWNADTNQLASGGNDNKLFVWGGTDSRPTWRFGEHRAAVKAIAWSPHQRGVLASGGGTADKKIRFWNSLTGGLVKELDTGSQVCNLMWSKNSNEIVSTHGYSGGPVQNQIHIWRYPSMTQVATLTGHTYRVLYLAMSPDGQTIVTGAGDETLRFWNAFQKGKGEGQEGSGADTSGMVKGAGGLNPFAKIR